jgi:hypothetical protein
MAVLHCRRTLYRGWFFLPGFLGRVIRFGPSQYSSVAINLSFNYNLRELYCSRLYNEVQVV